MCLCTWKRGWGQTMFPFDNIFPAGFPPAHLVFIGPLELWVIQQTVSGNAWCQGLTREVRSCELGHTVCACIIYALTLCPTKYIDLLVNRLFQTCFRRNVICSFSQSCQPQRRRRSGQRYFWLVLQQEGQFNIRLESFHPFSSHQELTYIHV